MVNEFLDEMREILARGERLPLRPNPEDLYQACGCNGPSTLMVTLEFLAARRQALAEVGVEEDPQRAAMCLGARGFYRRAA